MMRSFFVALAALAALAAPAVAQVTPGQWKVTATITSVEMPGVPPAMLGMMKRAHSANQCVTPEQAKQGPQEMLKSDKSCRFVRYSMAGGRIDAEMICAQSGGGTLTVASRGTYTATSFDTVATMVGTGSMPMKMTANTVGRLAGSCK